MRCISESLSVATLVWMSLNCHGFSAESHDAATDAVGKSPVTVQVIETLPVRVVDPKDHPVAGAVVTPWALRSAQGHGLWKADDDPSQMKPTAVITDAKGEATVAYPRFRNVSEGTRTIGVSIFVDQREFAYSEAIHIDVSQQVRTPYEVALEYGVAIELAPTLFGKPMDTRGLYVFWSGGRSWQSPDAVTRTTQSTLRLPPLKPGMHNALVAKLDGDRITHISRIVEFAVSSTDNTPVQVPLEPAQRIEGRISDNVQRPITNGRIQTRTLQPHRGDESRVEWFSWTPIRADGSFTIEAWPPGEKIQVIALCDGYIAKSGKAPAECKAPPDPAKDFFQRPQVFDPKDQEPIRVQMEPLVQCIATTLDEDDHPVAGITVTSWPNVAWWNMGAQVYCLRLVRCERLLRVRNYQACIDDAFPAPFRAITDNTGKATLELPEEKQPIGILPNERYELPVSLGSRYLSVALVSGQTAKITLPLQPKGTESLGEWDKLAGVVFGCTTRNGERICALPEVRKKMDEFRKRFREAKNKRDPKLLAEAYTLIADTLAKANDFTEAAKWRKKAAEQMEKAAAEVQ